MEAEQLPDELRERPERRNHKVNRRRIETLQRRADYLETRAGSPGSESYDEAEYQALRWAMWALRQWMAEDPYWVFDPPPGGGKGGQWRELGHGYWNEWERAWRVIDSKHDQPREATQREINEAKAEGEIEYIPPADRSDDVD
jgi:hypothetical protein